MFSKYLTVAVVFLAASIEVHAHAAVAPVLGVAGTPKRSDVKRPSTAAPCGAGVNIAQELGTSQAVTANGDSFTVQAINFNAGADGSREVSGSVDATGTGTNFVPITITKNGDGAPTSTGTDQIEASLPAGTKCTGGANKDTCLVSFVTTSKFGNCVAVKQGAGGAAAAGNAAAAGAAAGAAGAAAGKGAAGAAAGNGAAKGAAKAGGAKGKGKGKGKGGKKGGKRTLSGARLPRALLSSDESAQVAKRSALSWVWA